MAHERHIDHRHFVGDQKISLQGMAFVTRKSAHGGLDFQQPEDCLGLHAGRLREAFGGATRGRAQQAPHFLGAEDTQDALSKCKLDCFALAGA